MSSFLGKIKEFFKTKPINKKLYFGLFFVFAIVGIFIYKIDYVYALSFMEAVGNVVAAGIGSLITLICWAAVQLFIQLTIWASQLFITVASYNNFINSEAVKLGWVLVRDIVNMFFVVILLVIAFGTVLGLEQYEWKKLMVKLVFAAVLVNFSRLICGVIIDAAQVFMMTFVNGFAATAGGNVINALKLSEGLMLSTKANEANISEINYLIAAMAAAFFSVLSFFVLGAYAFIMVFRVVVLWVLIVLSPIAFISSVLPATQKYASEWWKEFNNHVLAGPILAFFFWLSFAIVGSGNIINEFDSTSLEAAQRRETLSAGQTLTSLSGASAGISELLEWSTMGSFVIAIALLLVGVQKTQELGIRGAGALSSAMATAKKVGMYAAGVKAAAWVTRKAPFVGTESWIRRGKGIKARVSERYHDITSRYEQWTAQKLKEGEGKKGLLGFAQRVAVSTILTPTQKEKQLKNLETAAEAAKKEREEKLGLGGTKIGKRAGARLMSAEIAKEKAEEDKMVGLGRAKIEQYKKQGDYSAAIRAERNLAARIMKMKSERFADMTQDDFVLEMSKLTEGRKKLLEDLEKTTDEEKRKSILSEIANKSFEIKTASIIAAKKGASYFNAVQGVIDKDTGVKNASEENAAAYIASKATGANTDTESGRKLAEEIMQFERKNNKANYDYLNTEMAKVFGELHERTSQHGIYVKGFSTGRVFEEGRKGEVYEVIKTDVGKNVGHATAKGEKRKEDEKYDPFGVDKEKEEYVTKLMHTGIGAPVDLYNLAANTNLGKGEKIELDLKKILPLNKALKELTPVGIIKALQSVSAQIAMLTRQQHWDDSRTNSLLKGLCEGLSEKQVDAVKHAITGTKANISPTEDDYQGPPEGNNP